MKRQHYITRYIRLQENNSLKWIKECCFPFAQIGFRVGGRASRTLYRRHFSRHRIYRDVVRNVVPLRINTMNFCEISEDNFNEWLSIGIALWPHAKKSLKKEFLAELKSGKHKHFLAQNKDGEYLGFINLSLRSDYVQGSSSSPVGYVEGIYVKPKYRKQGVAKELVQEAEKWAKKQGCTELGSDCYLNNTDSQKFHKNLGFKKAGVIVHYIRKIK